MALVQVAAGDGSAPPALGHPARRDALPGGSRRRTWSLRLRATADGLHSAARGSGPSGDREVS